MFKLATIAWNKNNSPAKKQTAKRNRKDTYHVLGICRDDSYRDPATMTFARMGLLASRCQHSPYLFKRGAT